jgi:hypothetical protein
MLVDDVENIPLSAFDPDDADRHIIAGGQILEGAIDRNDLSVEVVRKFSSGSRPRIDSAVVANLVSLN